MTDAVGRGGGVALALVMLAENVFPPIPSEAVLPFAGFLVEQGELTFAVALSAATLGSTVGAVVLYTAGRWGGRALLLRHGHLFRLSRRDLDRADDWFDRHGPKVVFVARMVPLFRSVVSVPAGTSEMPLGRFVVLTAAGSALWNAVLLGLGVAFGERYAAVGDAVGRGSTVLVVVLGVGLLAAAGWWYRSRGPRHDALAASPARISAQPLEHGTHDRVGGERAQRAGRQRGEVLVEGRDVGRRDGRGPCSPQRPRHRAGGARLRLAPLALELAASEPAPALDGLGDGAHGVPARDRAPHRRRRH